MDTILSGEHILKTFGSGDEKTTALDRINVRISTGEFVAVMGPSGSGKSTLLFVLSGTDTVESGDIRLGGECLTEMTENRLADLRRSKMGFVFQQPTMLKTLNILDNILLPAVQRGNTAQVVKRGRSLMKKTGIAALENRNITEVSGGQLQRAGICRALINDPEIIFADEPTGALNSGAAEDIMDLFAGIHEEGTAILLVTHDPRMAARSQRVLFMLDGQIRGEYTLGKYVPKLGDKKEREVALSAWLTKMGL